MRGEHLRVLSFIHTLLLCDGEAPILLTRDLVTFSHINGDWMSLHLCQGGIASDAVAEWGTWGYRCDFLMHIYLIFLNAFDLPLNVWPPECVFHDTYPYQLLRSNCCLPMDSVVGMSIGKVMIYTSHEPGTSYFCNSLCNLLWKDYYLPLLLHQSDLQTCPQAHSRHMYNRDGSRFIFLPMKYQYIFSWYTLYQWTAVYLYATSIYEWNEREARRY